jgi:hypothetical protein
LNRIRRCSDQRLDHPWQIFDAPEKRRFVEKTVVDRDIETAPRARIEKAIQSRGFHEPAHLTNNARRSLPLNAQSLILLSPRAPAQKVEPDVSSGRRRSLAKQPDEDIVPPATARMRLQRPSAARNTGSNTSA